MKIKSNLFLSVILFSAFCGLSSANNENQYIKKGDYYYSRFDNRNAVMYYQKAYRADKNSYYSIFKLTRSYNDLGEELYMLKNDDGAEKYIKKGADLSAVLVKKFPDSSLSYTLEAMCLGNLSLFGSTKKKIQLSSEVFSDANKAIKMNPNDFLPYTILGIYYRQVAGLSWFDKLIAGAIYGKIHKGSYQESIEMFDKSLKLDPNVISTEYNLYKTYEKLNNKKMEIECLEKLLKLPVTNFRDKYLIPRAKKNLAELLN